MKTFITLFIIFFIYTLSFSQSWLQTHSSLNIPNKPSVTKLGDIIAVNGGNQIGNSSLPNAGVIKTLRDFYHMEIDYNYSYFPTDGKLNANECSCANVWCDNGDCNTFINNPGGPSSFSSKKGFYCAWNGSGYQFDEIYSTLESIFPKKGFGGCHSGADVDRSYPNKWYSISEWGGLNNIEQNFANYLIPYLTTYCPADTSKPCLIDVLEIGNEPWGDPYPGMAGYQKMLNAAVTTFQQFYGSNDPKDWRMKLSTAALEAHDANPNNFGGTEMYIEDMVPQNLRQYFDYVNIHPYAFPLDNSYFGVGERPESENGAFLTLKNMVDWRNNQMPDAKVNVTEFGWNAGVPGDGCGPFGESSQSAYTMRAFLLAARHGIHRAFVYAMTDNHEYPLYCTTGLYEDLASNNTRKAFESIQKLKSSDLNDKRFLKALVENADQANNGTNGAYVYLFGDNNGYPTHLVAWRPDVLNYENTNYPSISNSYYTVNLPDTSLRVVNRSKYFYLGWDNIQDALTGNNNSTDVNISGTSSNSVDIKLSATPIVIPLANNNCIYNSDGVLNCSRSSSQDELTSKAEISIYPNPANSVVRVKYNLKDYNKNVNITLINIYGQIVKEETINSNKTFSFDIADIDNGSYLLLFRNKNGETQTKKLQILK